MKIYRGDEVVKTKHNSGRCHDGGEEADERPIYASPEFIYENIRAILEDIK